MAKKKIRIGITSLGCPKTLVDSEVILGKLNEARYVLTNKIDESDIVLLNTCGFIRDAKQESIDAILRLLNFKKQGKIRGLIVMGCLVQRYARELAKEFPEVDAFVGSGDYDKIVAVVEKVAVGRKQTLVQHSGYLSHADEFRVPLTPKYYRYLKISEGCDHTCSFCVIPALRGKFRSRSIKDVVSEARRLVREGAKEIILIGQDITKFGYDYAKKPLLPQLLDKLESIPGVPWIRLLYAYPSSVTDSLVQAMAKSKKICHYLDLPLQHINDRILRAMRRGIDKRKTVELIRKLRSAVPGLVIRTSFIVGFPGETEREFQELLGFMREMKFERVGIFKYSAEEGSPAARFPKQVHERVKEKRYHAAMRLQRRIARDGNRRYLGITLPVLVEEMQGKTTNVWRGRTAMDAPDVDGCVLIHSSKTLKPGSFYEVKIKDAKEYDLIGEV